MKNTFKLGGYYTKIEDLGEQEIYNWSSGEYETIHEGYFCELHIIKNDGCCGGKVEVREIWFDFDEYTRLMEEDQGFYDAIDEASITYQVPIKNCEFCDDDTILIVDDRGRFFVDDMDIDEEYCDEYCA